MRQLPIFALLLGLMAPMAQPSNTAEDWLNQGENDQTQHSATKKEDYVYSRQPTDDIDRLSLQQH